MASQLFRLILLHRWQWRLGILLLSFLSALFGILGPYIQKHFIDSLLSVPSKDLFGFESQLSPFLLMLIALCFLLLSQGVGFIANYIGMKESILSQQILSKKLYEKTMTLHPDSLQGKTVGEMVSLYATDVMGATIFLEQSLPIGAATLFPLILAPLALHLLFEIPLTQVLLTMGVIIFINSYLALRQSKFFTRFKQLAADRLGLVNEWILNIKSLKVMGWIDAFETKIHAMRVKETNNRVAMVTNGQTMNSISSTATFIINIVAITVLVNHHQSQVTPGELLSLLWILGVFLSRPFRQLPWFFTFGFDGWTSLKRIGHFLQLQNQGREWPHGVSADETNTETEGPSIEVQNLNLKIGKEHLLKNINFSIKQKEFVAIVGEVGSGKSLLLLSLIGETGASMDVYRINHRNILSASHQELCRHFAYVPQEGFVMSATLRDNIAFDYDVNSKMDSRIYHCLELSQLNLDQEPFPERLDTEIGERGVNLSGGQKQRVNIARADFYDCPVVLLDDSLSALDVNTEAQVMQSLLKGRWAHKTRILTTHRLSALKEVDRIFFLEDGEILAQGTLNELLQSSIKFKYFIETHQSTEKSKVSHEVEN